MIDIEDERELESKIGGQCVTRDEENLLNSICSFNSNFIEKEEETVMQDLDVVKSSEIVMKKMK